MLSSFNSYLFACGVIFSSMFVCVQRRQRCVFSKGWQCWAQASLWFSTLRENCATLSSACIIKIQTRVIMPWKSPLSTAPKNVDQYVSNGALISGLTGHLIGQYSLIQSIVDQEISCVSFIRRKALHEKPVSIDLTVVVTDSLWKIAPYSLSWELTETRSWLLP